MLWQLLYETEDGEMTSEVTEVDKDFHKLMKNLRKDCKFFHGWNFATIIQARRFYGNSSNEDLVLKISPFANGIF